MAPHKATIWDFRSRKEMDEDSVGLDAEHRLSAMCSGN